MPAEEVEDDWERKGGGTIDSHRVEVARLKSRSHAADRLVSPLDNTTRQQ